MHFFKKNLQWHVRLSLGAREKEYKRNTGALSPAMLDVLAASITQGNISMFLSIW